MAISKTEICNMALANVGITSTIIDVDDPNDTTSEAVNCRLFYDICRKSLLAMARWPFSAKVVDLVDSGVTPTNWSYRYLYPNDAVRANYIINPTSRTPSSENKIPFDIINISDGTGYGKAILCDQNEAKLDYNQNITDTNLFDYSFVMALSFFLGERISVPLKVSAELTKVNRDNFLLWTSEALTHTFREKQEDPYPESQFYNARF